MAATPLPSWLDTAPPFFELESPPPFFELEPPPPFFEPETPPHLEGDSGFPSYSASRDLQNTERILSPTRYMKLACRDGDLWIRWLSWDVTTHLPVVDEALDYETFVITLRRVDRDEVLEMMTDIRPFILPTLLDRLKCDGFTNLFDKLDGKALRTLWDFRNADFHPRKAWIKREFLLIKAMAAVMRVCFQSRESSLKRLGNISLSPCHECKSPELVTLTETRMQKCKNVGERRLTAWFFRGERSMNYCI
jgi:hypothetical protein